MECYDHLFERAMKAADAGKNLLARDLLREYVEFEPNEPRGWVQLAAQYRELKEWGNARAAAGRALPVIDQKYFAHQLIGRCFADEDRWDEAVEAYKCALAEKPTPETWIFLGYAYTNLRRNSAAIDAYKAAVKLNPVNEEALYNLGCCYSRACEYKKAIRCFQRAIEVDPEYAIAYAQLGDAMIHPLNKESLACAKPVLIKSVELDPHYYWSRIYLGFVLNQLGDKAGAIEQYEAAIRIAPADSLAHEFLGDALAYTGNRRRAAHHLQKAVRLEPDREEAFCALGKWCARWGRFRDAEKFLRRAIELGSKYAAKYLSQIPASELTPKQQRRPICRSCGEPVSTRRNAWWCPGCGADLRAPKERRKHDPENPNFAKPRK